MALVLSSAFGCSSSSPAGGNGADGGLGGSDGSSPHDAGGVDQSASDAPSPPTDGSTGSSSDGGDLRFFAGTGTAGGVHASTWVHDQGAWTGPGLITVPTQGTVAWIAAALDYDGTELLAVESQFATTTGIDVLSGTGSSFASEISIPGLRPAATADHRSFDMVLEGDSNALLVYSDDSPIPKYRERVAIAPVFWSPEQPAFATAPGTGKVEWVQLAARANTNTIALLYSTSNRELFVSLWNGTVWGTPIQLAPQTFASFDGGSFPLYSANWQCFGGAYTDPGGDLFIGYSLDMNAVNAGFTWTVLVSGQDTFPPPTPVSSFVPPGPLAIASQPGTNQIAISYLQEDGTSPSDNFDALIWQNSQIQNFTALDTHYGLTGYGAGASPDSVGWLPYAGSAVAVYAHAEPDGGISGNLGWGEWTATNGWVLQPEATMQPPLAQLTSARIATLATGDRLFAFLQTVNGPVFAKSFDGNSWNDTYDGGAIEPSTSRTTGVPFAALPR